MNKDNFFDIDITPLQNIENEINERMKEDGYIVIRNLMTESEINAIRMACKNIGNYRLNDCDIFITLEPCHMCAKAIIDSRIKKVYFAAREPKTGSLVSVDNFFEKSFLNHHIQFEEGCMRQESSNLLRKFFQELRNKSP